MASPQLEDGYTKIANELFEALCRVQLSGHEWSYVMAVMRKTYGYNKKEDWVTNTQIAQMTGLRKERVSEAKRRLLEKKIVTENRNKISLNKNYEEWLELRKTVTPVTENRNKKLRKTVSTKEKKETIQKTVVNTKEKLPTNKLTNMGWNNHSDDYLEGEVQLDPDYTPAQKKKEKAADELQQVFDLFDNPARHVWRLRKIERESAKVLIETYGLETLKKRMQRIQTEQKKNDPLFPLVVSPSQLLEKMPNVERYLGI